MKGRGVSLRGRGSSTCKGPVATVVRKAEGLTGLELGWAPRRWFRIRGCSAGPLPHLRRKRRGMAFVSFFCSLASGLIDMYWGCGVFQTFVGQRDQRVEKSGIVHAIEEFSVHTERESVNMCRRAW